MNLLCVGAKFRSCLQRQRSMLIKIPPEIIDYIFKFLSVLDQICLALSCKSMYTRFLCVLEVQKLRLSELLPPQGRPVMHRNIDDLQNWPRIQLLHRLQDRRWKYCSGCWNLHRHSAWRYPLGSLLRPRSNLPSPRRPLCMPYAGKFEFCPCLTMTFPDMLHLIGTIKLAKAKDPSTRRYYSIGMFCHPISGRIRGMIRHVCTFRGHPLADVRVAVLCSWNETCGSLEIRRIYSFRKKKPFETHGTKGDSSSQLAMMSPSMPLKTPFMCPHKNSKRWLEQFFAEASTTFSGLSRRFTASTDDPCDCHTAGKEFEPYENVYINIYSSL